MAYCGQLHASGGAAGAQLGDSRSQGHEPRRGSVVASHHPGVLAKIPPTGRDMPPACNGCNQLNNTHIENNPTLSVSGVSGVPSVPAAESERQRALPSAPSALNQLSVSGVSSVSSV